MVTLTGQGSLPCILVSSSNSFWCFTLYSLYVNAMIVSGVKAICIMWPVSICRKYPAIMLYPWVYKTPSSKKWAKIYLCFLPIWLNIVHSAKEFYLSRSRWQPFDQSIDFVRFMTGLSDFSNNDITVQAFVVPLWVTLYANLRQEERTADYFPKKVLGFLVGGGEGGGGTG